MPAIPIVQVSGGRMNAVQAAKTDGKLMKLPDIKDAFSSYMRQGSSHTAQAAKQDAAPQEVEKAQQPDANVQEQYAQYRNKASAQTDKVSSGNGTDENTDAVTQAVDEATAEIKKAIQENLGVDEEQLKEAMELLGFVPADLLNPQRLVALCVQLTGNENVEMMLFSENFQGVMQEVTTITEGMLREIGMTLDELNVQLQTMQQVSESVPQQADVPPVENAPVLAEQPQQEVTAVQSQETAPESVPQTETHMVRNVSEAQVVQTEETVRQETVSQEARTAQKAEVPQEDAPQEEVQETAQSQEQDGDESQPQAQTDTSESEFDAKGSFLERQTQGRETQRSDFGTQVRTHEPNAGVQQPQDVTVQARQPQIDVQDVIRQIAEYTRIHTTGEVKSVEMQLNPENLGRVYVHVSEKEGAVTAQLTAQNENVKEALIQQAVILKETLSQQGIKVEAVEITAGAHEFERNLERDARGQEEQARQQEEQNIRRGRRSINLNEFDSLDGLAGLMSEEEMLAAQIMRDNGNNVDYKA